MYAPHLRTLIIRPTLRALGMWSKPAEDLLMGTVAVESNMGQWIAQVGGGPALGIYQIEPLTAEDVVLRYLAARPDLERRFIDAVGLFLDDDHRLHQMQSERLRHKLVVDLAFQTAVARVKYWMSPAKLPSETLARLDYINALGEYWKTHYNTAGGRGTVAKFCDKYWLTEQR